MNNKFYYVILLLFFLSCNNQSNLKGRWSLHHCDCGIYSRYVELDLSNDLAISYYNGSSIFIREMNITDSFFVLLNDTITPVYVSDFTPDEKIQGDTFKYRIQEDTLFTEYKPQYINQGDTLFTESKPQHCVFSKLDPSKYEQNDEFDSRYYSRERNYLNRILKTVKDSNDIELIDNTLDEINYYNSYKNKK